MIDLRDKNKIAGFYGSLIAVLVGISLMLALVGPFGTYEVFGLVMRFAYWMPIVFLAYGLIMICNVVVDRLSPSMPVLWFEVACGLLFSIIFGPLIWLFSHLFPADGHTFPSMIMMSLEVFGVSLVISGLKSVFFSITPVATLPLIYQRLPAGTTAGLVRMTVDNHHVELHLDDGTTHRLLMRFADAVKEMEGLAGFCTHRSHWVAANYIKGSLREQSRDYLMMQTGEKIPVSKTYRDIVVNAGFL